MRGPRTVRPCPFRPRRAAWPHGCDEPAAEVGAQHRGDHVERIEGVSDVSVEIPNGRLTVHSTPTVTDEAVHAAIGQAGYTIAASA